MQEVAYVRIRHLIESAPTLNALSSAWKAAQSEIKTLPEHWQQFLAAAKDEAKAKF